MYFHFFPDHSSAAFSQALTQRQNENHTRETGEMDPQSGDRRDGSTVRSAVFLQKTKLAPKLACPKLPLIPSDLKPLVL